MAHKHAAAMALYAEDAAKQDQPWLNWEFNYRINKQWVMLTKHPAWAENCIYRRRKPHSAFGDTLIPTPATSCKDGEPVWSAMAPYETLVFASGSAQTYFQRTLAQGLLHTNKSAAMAHHLALVAINMKLLKLTQP